MNTPLRRASFVVAVVGAIALCVGAYHWLDTYPNIFLNRTTSIPDYPRADDQIPRESVVQIHRRCEWKYSPPSDANMFDYQGPVMLWDNILSLDTLCAKKFLSGRSYKEAGVLLAASKRSHQLMMRDAVRGASWASWFSPDKEENMSAPALYQRHMVSEMVKVGVPQDDAARVLEACTKTEARYCVEAQRYVYVNVWSVLWSTWPLAAGFVLLLAGLAGSLFLTPLAALWRFSGGRVIEWIRRGN